MNLNIINEINPYTFIKIQTDSFSFENILAEDKDIVNLRGPGSMFTDIKTKARQPGPNSLHGVE